MSKDRCKTIAAGPIEGPAREPLSDLLTTNEAAGILRITRGTLYEWIRTKQLPATRIGRKILIDRSVLEQVLERQKGSQ